MTTLDHERRILDLELELGKAMRVAEEARTLAAIMRRNTLNLDDALTVAEGWNKRQKWVQQRDDNPPCAYPVEGWMPSLIQVEKAIAELTGIDGDDEWWWKQRHPVEPPPEQNDVFDLLEGLKEAWRAVDPAKAQTLAAGFARGTGGIDVEFLIQQLGPPMYTQEHLKPVHVHSRAQDASVDTLPKGQDAQQGLAGTEGSAVGEAETPIPGPIAPSAGR